MFHLNVPDRLGYACRLLRKAHSRGAKVVVSAPPATLVRLDKLLWTFEATDFVPHLHVAAAAAVAPHLKDTPIWLVEHVEKAPHHEALLNLVDYYDEATGFSAMERTTGWDAAITLAMAARGVTPRGAGGVESFVPATPFVAELRRLGFKISVDVQLLEE